MNMFILIKSLKIGFLQDGVICDPAIFNEFCMRKSPSGIFSFNGPPSMCKEAACNFKEIRSPPIVSYFQVLEFENR